MSWQAKPLSLSESPTARPRVSARATESGADENAPMAILEPLGAVRGCGCWVIGRDGRVKRVAADPYPDLARRRLDLAALLGELLDRERRGMNRYLGDRWSRWSYYVEDSYAGISACTCGWAILLFGNEPQIDALRNGKGNECALCRFGAELLGWSDHKAAPVFGGMVNREQQLKTLEETIS